MEPVITALTAALTPAVFFGQIEDLVPFIVVVVPISLALMFLRRLVKGAARGKVSF